MRVADRRRVLVVSVLEKRVSTERLLEVIIELYNMREALRSTQSESSLELSDRQWESQQLLRAALRLRRLVKERLVQDAMRLTREKL